ncbi:MAG: hypothetical protein NXI21_11175 [Alphaproteobacteria bacterium]|nr:hypothetical protein [Alphaproteobacteria bacterium]
MGESKRRRAAGPTPGVAKPKAARTPRLTGRTIAWFLAGCLLLDVMLWAVFRFGLARCYGVLCLL